MDADALARLLRRAREVNRVDVTVDDMVLPALYAAVKETPAIAGLTLLDAVRVTFRETLRENLTVMSGIYTALGALIAIGVVYNGARIQLSERTHELASLRVLGFTRMEVSNVLVGELMLLTIVALPIGWGLGYLFASLVATGFCTDIVTVPPRRRAEHLRLRVGDRLSRRSRLGSRRAAATCVGDDPLIL